MASAFKIWRGDKYGFSPAAYEQMLERQNGCCALCDTVPDKVLVIDHDHITGRVRGLLCHNCNTGLGMFKDNPEALRAAIWYLDNHSRRLAATG